MLTPWFSARPSRDRKQSAAGRLAAIVAIVKASHFLGFWDRCDGPWYDVVLRMRARAGSRAERVLLVPLREEPWSLDRIVALSRELRQLGATSVSVLSHGPGQWSRLWADLPLEPLPTSVTLVARNGVMPAHPSFGIDYLEGGGAFRRSALNRLNKDT